MGFYDYVVAYLYRPALLRGPTGLAGRVLAMACVYAFVFLYHGATAALARWTALNFAQVLAERLVLGACRGSPAYRAFEVGVPNRRASHW